MQVRLRVVGSATGASAVFTAAGIRFATVATFFAISASTVVNRGDRTIVSQAALRACFFMLSALVVICEQHQGGA